MHMTRWVYAAALAVVFGASPAHAGSLTTGSTTSGPWDWSLTKSWTNGSDTLSLTFSGNGALTADLAAFFNLLALPQLPATSLTHTVTTTNTSTTSGATTTGTTTTTSTTTASATLPPAPVVTTTTTTSDPTSVVTTTTTTVNPPAGDVPIAPVPEPSGVAMALTGLGALGFVARRYRRTA